MTCSGAWAVDPSGEREPDVPHSEWWAGAQSFDHSWSIYSGATLAPFASIQQDGLRLRAVAGYGAYSYQGLRAAQPLPIVRKFRGETGFAELLGGYQIQYGPVTVKAFGGVLAEDIWLQPDDPENAIKGAGWGGKVALETWWNATDRAWVSLDLNWATLHDTYSARTRLGWRFTPALSAGLEAGLTGSEQYGGVHAGPFLRHEWATGELNISGGLATDNPSDQPWADAAQSSAPYATLTWLTRF
jgi:hypothetical protein